MVKIEETARKLGPKHKFYESRENFWKQGAIHEF